MNPDSQSNLLAAATTCTLSAIKITILSKEGSTPEAFYFFIAAYAIVFWRSILPITDALLVKEYIRSWSRLHGDFKLYKKESPFRYYFSLVIAALMGVFTSSLMFSLTNP